MKTLIMTAVAVVGLAASVSTAFAHANPAGFYAIQRSQPYDSAPAVRDAVPMRQQAMRTSEGGDRVYLPQYRIWVPAASAASDTPVE
ncbi:hypothetical protein [Labrys wisconsinensis]|nr:hypothetical protein [Labrys wisconsinensis]